MERQNVFKVLTLIYCTLSTINIMPRQKSKSNGIFISQKDLWPAEEVTEENKKQIYVAVFQVACVSDLVGGEVRRTVCGGAAPGAITVATETGKGLAGCTAAAPLGWTLVWTTGMGAIWMIFGGQENTNKRIFKQSKNRPRFFPPAFLENTHLIFNNLFVIYPVRLKNIKSGFMAFRTVLAFC